MDFKIIGPIEGIEVIAQGRGIKNVNRLNKIYGRTNWRKLKGNCIIEFMAKGAKNSTLQVSP